MVLCVMDSNDSDNSAPVVKKVLSEKIKELRAVKSSLAWVLDLSYLPTGETVTTIGGQTYVRTRRGNLVRVSQ